MIQQNIQTGEMVRQRAIHGNAKKRDLAHAHHERHMAEVEEHAEAYIKILVRWMELLNQQAIVTIIGWYAQTYGLSFCESLYRLYWYGDANFIRICREYGKAHA